MNYKRVGRIAEHHRETEAAENSSKLILGSPGGEGEAKDTIRR
jgi:peptide subunit release factor 1 (eRF1)